MASSTSAAWRAPSPTRSRPLRVLFVALRWDYGQRHRGDSFEYANLWDALTRLPDVEARFFGFDEHEASLGRDGMNRALVEEATSWKPDLAFFFLFTNQFDRATIRRITSLPGTTTLNWFADDHWRFNDFSRHWAPLFDWVVTTDWRAVRRYRRAGYDRAVYSQWGCNVHLYGPTGEAQDIDVSFVGQPYGDRRAMIERLRATGFDVRAWGEGWENGRLTQREMVSVFSRSKININFAASSLQFNAKMAAAQVLRRHGRLVVPRPPREIRENLIQLRDSFRPQIKARNFEVAGCGGFLLTDRADRLDRFYALGREVVTFRGYRQLEQQVRRYLDAEDERAAIARAAYERTLRDHSYERRFGDLFQRIGLA